MDSFITRDIVGSNFRGALLFIFTIISILQYVAYTYLHIYLLLFRFTFTRQVGHVYVSSILLHEILNPFFVCLKLVRKSNHELQN